MRELLFLLVMAVLLSIAMMATVLAIYAIAIA